MPGGNVLYAVLGLVIFGGYTVVDFNRLRNAESDDAAWIACGIFLDIINVFHSSCNSSSTGGSVSHNGDQTAQRWTEFAAIMITLGGVLNVVWGIAAISDTKFF
jgi:hypothetical protein